MADNKQRNIAYRCPECGETVFGLIGRFALSANLLRLKCSCDKPSGMDIAIDKDKKIRLSVPCIFCRQNHSYTLSDEVFFERELTTLPCPYTGIDIAFIGGTERIEPELVRTGEEIGRLMASLEAEELSDIQPRDLDEGDTIADPAVYDTVRFILKDLESEGLVKCPCGEGPYDIRYCDGGVEAYCDKCGASYQFKAMSATMAEEYLSLDRLDLR